jgi:hypothetical protein
MTILVFSGKACAGLTTRCGFKKFLAPSGVAFREDGGYWCTIGQSNLELVSLPSIIERQMLLSLCRYEGLTQNGRPHRSGCVIHANGDRLAGLVATRPHDKPACDSKSEPAITTCHYAASHLKLHRTRLVGGEGKLGFSIPRFPINLLSICEGSECHGWG